MIRERGKCECKPGWTGSFCHKPKCKKCVNGMCIAPNTCKCFDGWFGGRCDVPLCSPSCLNGGICIAPDTCWCSSGWVGQTCEVQSQCPIFDSNSCSGDPPGDNPSPGDSDKPEPPGDQNEPKTSKSSAHRATFSYSSVLIPLILTAGMLFMML